jgi:DNA helicase-2/ATP-dependent DNA helicase PcrA
LPEADIEQTRSAALARVLSATTFTGQFPLMARRARTIEVWEQPERRSRIDATSVGTRVVHQKYGYGTVKAAEQDRLDVAFDRARASRPPYRFMEKV